jgi:hypothetical protein
VEGRPVVLGQQPLLIRAGDAGGQQERPPRSGEDVADRLDGVALGLVRDGRVGEVMLVGEMEDGVGLGGARPDAGQVVQVTTADLDAFFLEGRRGGVGSGEPDDLVTAGEQLVDCGRTDPPGCSGDENPHVSDLLCESI